jgi:hypothetical protein
MAVFKEIGGGNHIVEPFEVNYSQSFEWISGSTSNLSGSGFSINLANEPPTNYPISTTQSLGGVTDGGFNSHPMFNSVKKYFYVGETGSSSDIYGFYPSGSMFVWNVGSKYTGDGIKPDTFKVELIATTASGLYLQDDGNGKLRINKTGSIVGNVFYNHGIVTAQRNITASESFISADGISISSSAGTTSSFHSMIDIYEHTVNCRIDPTELNVTLNPTSFHSGSAAAISAGTASYNNHIISGSVLPYVTTIGLYNNSNELLAVGKLSKPIVRTKYTDQTFVVKFDE